MENFADISSPWRLFWGYWSTPAVQHTWLENIDDGHCSHLMGIMSSSEHFYVSLFANEESEILRNSVHASSYTVPKQQSQDL